jgi:hypothetical protein
MLKKKSNHKERPQHPHSDDNLYYLLPLHLGEFVFALGLGFDLRGLSLRCWFHRLEVTGTRLSQSTVSLAKWIQKNKHQCHSPCHCSDACSTDYPSEDEVSRALSLGFYLALSPSCSATVCRSRYMCSERILSPST